MTVVTRCEHCQHTFEVAKSLMGGITNCPECAKATSVAGLRDPLWRLWQVGIPVIGVAAGYGAGHFTSMTATMSLILGVSVAAGLWLLSRGL